jgi:predicted secreted hydrolase
MTNIQYTTSPGVPPQSMEDEFLSHKNGSEWWYCTGYLHDESGRLFSFQFTLSKVIVYGIRLHILMTALSDFETGKHYYSQQAFFFGRKVNITPSLIGVEGQAVLRFDNGKLELSIRAKDHSLSLDMNAVKPPVWHCDNGVLRMGLDDPKQTTYYWSYTNLRATGKLVLGNKKSKVSGKAWFDRQGGTYNIINRWTHWEWFSIRFFDDEEVMLFSFPQSNYQDGTYIDKEGNYERLKDYSIKPQGFTEAGGHKFSLGWEVEIEGVKDEKYTIVPKMDGQVNLTYYELLADVRDKEGNTVGYCVVELLPGVYNKHIKVWAVLARVK